MATLTVHAPANAGRMLKAQIAAQYTGVDLKYVPGFEFRKSNKTPEFLAKFPLGKVPAVDTPYGPLTESGAIARYVARIRPEAGLMGGSFYQQALVDQWIDFSTTELEATSAKWLYPIWGYGTFDQKTYDDSKATVSDLLKYVDNHLIDNTYLTGDVITLGDIVLWCACKSLFGNVITESQATSNFPSVVRWYNTLLAQKQFSSQVTPAFAWAPSEKYAAGNPLAGAAAAAPAAAPKEEKKVEKKEEVKAAAPAPTPAAAPAAEAPKPAPAPVAAEPAPTPAPAKPEPEAKKEESKKAAGKKGKKEAEPAPAAAETPAPAAAPAAAEPEAKKEETKKEEPKGKKGKKESTKKEAEPKPEVKAAEPAPAPAPEVKAAPAPEPEAKKEEAPKAAAKKGKQEGKAKAEAPKAAESPKAAAAPKVEAPKTPKGKTEAPKAAESPKTPKGKAETPKGAAKKGKGK